MRAAAPASAAIAALPARLKPVADAVRAAGGWIVSTHFTLVPGKGGEPFISPHLKALRPFLRKGDFAPGSWGHALVDELQPADLSVEKVAFSAFYMSRLEWVLRKAGIETLVFSGIVTNGGVASTLRDAHVRDFAYGPARGRLRCLLGRGSSNQCRSAPLGGRGHDLRRLRRGAAGRWPMSVERCQLLRGAERGAHACHRRRGLRTCRGVDGEADRCRGARARA